MELTKIKTLFLIGPNTEKYLVKIELQFSLWVSFVMEFISTNLDSTQNFSVTLCKQLCFLDFIVFSKKLQKHKMNNSSSILLPKNYNIPRYNYQCKEQRSNSVNIQGEYRCPQNLTERIDPLQFLYFTSAAKNKDTFRSLSYIFYQLFLWYSYFLFSPKFIYKKDRH